MRLTKKLESEILKVYYAYWEAYLKGDLKNFASFLDENVTVFGTALGEVFTNKKEAIKFYSATADQMTGKADFRKRRIKMKTAGNTVVVNEECDLYVLIDGLWTFYDHARITAIIEQKGNAWKCVHQHGSFPDTRTEEGDQIATQKIKKENLQLKEAVKRRTIELEEKNRELEIETALEKVRTVAMGMKRREDMLQICKTISQQMAKLGVKEIRNVQTAIFNVPRGTYMNYEYYAKHNKTFITETLYTNHKVARTFAAKMLKGRGEVSITHIKGKQKVKEWLNYQKGTNVFIDSFLNKATSLTYYWYSLGPVALGISTYFPLTKEEQQLFSRFLKVFELAYRRYLDIEKAEAQAREAQIEAALERIRAASLAMRDSSALSTIIFRLYAELTKLDAKLDRCFIMIVNQENKGITWWMAGQEGLLAENGFFVQMNQHASHLMYLDHCKQRKKKWTYLFEGKEKRDWDRFGFSKTELARLPAPVKAFMSAAKKVYLSGSSDQFGSLVTGSFEPLPEEQQDIISRFAVVFNQTYTRFLDLQKAEAQAREAQIEAALERVRSRSLAMHKSEELKEVIRMVLEQFIQLNIKAEHAGFYIDYKAHDDMHIWLADPNLEPFYAVIPYFDTPTWNSFLEAKAKGITLHTDLLDFKAKNKFYRSLFKLFAIPEEAKKFYLQCKGLAVSTVLLDSVGLYIENFDGTPYTDEENNILIRFGKVFQQAYTRFLDLQKAERQAREAQIEMALERVRSRTMAMRHSNELADAAQLLYQQFHSLKISTFTCGYMFINEEKNTQGGWTVLPDGTLLQDFTDFPLTGDPILNERYKQWKNKKALHSVVVEGKVNKEHHRFLKSKVPEKFSNDILRHIPERMIFNSANFSNGYLFIISLEPFTAEEEQVVIRFAKVFDQTYTRFLDLQKAEEQAKEAEIQLALERVRARSLAMHHTSELQEVVNIAAQQLHGIGMDINGGVFIAINTEIEKELSIWASGGMADYIQKVIVPELNKPIFTTLRDAIKRGNSFLIESFSDKEKRELFTHLFKYEPWKSLPKERKEELLSRKGGFARSVVISHYTSISITNHNGKAFTEDENKILKRFGKVFEQSYIRFLDLQKAEAQAREAQIEAALERVRARAMAMHSSNELNEVVHELRKQMGLLGQKGLETCVIHLHDESPDFIHSWAAIKPPETESEILESRINVPKKGLLIIEEAMKAYDSNRQDYIIMNEGKKREQWFSFLEKESPESYNTLMESANGNIENLRAFWSFADFPGGSLLMVTMKDPNDLTRNLLRRFANVFGLAYRRFADLKKAEAQAREAKIEAALERVRSQAMAMRQSADLLDVVVTMRNEFTRLGHEAHYFWYMRWLPDKYEKAMTSGDGTRIGMVMTLPRHIHGDIKLVADWEKGDEPTLVFAMDVETAVDYVDKMINLGDFEQVDPQAPTLDDIRHIGGLTFIMARTMHGEIGYSLPGVVPNPPDDDIKTLVRFAVVFDLAYRRFEDLKLAEQKNRETEIELALEKVRSRTMAMQKSDELGDVATVLFKELNVLVKNLWTCGFVLCEKDKGEDEWWISTESGFIPAFYLPNTGDITHENIYQGWLSGEVYHTEQLEGEALQQHYDWLMTVPVAKKIFEDMSEAGYEKPEWQKLHCAYFSKGYLCIITREPSAEEEIFKRFAQVFDLTYTRFLDLQKAEAQAREAEIQLALERVRSKAMAMHTSFELESVAFELRNQIGLLGSKELETCAINLYDELDNEVIAWGAMRPPENQNDIRVFNFSFPKKGIALIDEMIKAYSSGAAETLILLEGEKMAQWMKVLAAARPDIFAIVDESVHYSDTGFHKAWFSCAFFPGGTLIMITFSEPNVESRKLLTRFSQVFGLAYRRFADLKKAEAQAREAQIEASLERVRSKTMSMHNSQDVGATVTSMFEELVKLGVPKTVRCGIGILKDTTELELWTAYWGEGDNVSLVLGRIDTSSHPLLSGAANAWKNNKSTFYYELQGEDLMNYYKVLNDAPHYDFHVDVSSLPEKLIHHSFYFPDGTVFAFAREPLTVEMMQIFKRFAAVFGQTYRRYLDLLKAEANTREAQIEAALEKVRSRTMAMQKSDELSGTAAVLFQQLIALGIAPNRLYIILTKENNNEMEAWVTDEDGSKVSMGFTGDYQKNPSLKKMYEGWLQQKKSLVIDMQGEELQQYFHYLHNELKVPFKGGLEQKRRIQYIAYFSHGLIGMASPDEQSAETLHLLERFAAVFNLTFTRFNDLKIAEAHALQAEQDLIAIKEAKQKAEAALTELQSTQKQLIQSEKMASLGELTAGIAHEIQNPLNFVNNFSEVSKELLDEMKEAIEKGDTEDAKEIMNDVIQNLEKINHHGKRADSIVKGMLQHSRSSTGQKELTDINALCDEYLRLAYHGLRAKDKSFNAKFETQFDETVGNLNVIPQDIGRVVLNLINNAFYAVSDRKKLNQPGYEPTVSVSTNKNGNKVVIGVKDNGTGIPQKVLDKIFQPFFTTKPTGLGTGLGLSLSYDIITKGHGGELKVETKEGEGTEFFILLPI